MQVSKREMCLFMGWILLTTSNQAHAHGELFPFFYILGSQIIIWGFACVWLIRIKLKKHFQVTCVQIVAFVVAYAIDSQISQALKSNGSLKTGGGHMMDAVFFYLCFGGIPLLFVALFITKNKKRKLANDADLA
jgi:hypothetical protein